MHKLWDADWPKDVLAHFETMPEELAARSGAAARDAAGEAPAISRASWRWTSSIWTPRRWCGSICACRAWAGPRRGRFATSWPCARRRARAGVAVPEFCGTANHDALWQFLSRTQGPWLLKPRASASAIGIQKFSDPNAVWPMLERLGDEASHHLVERFVPGEIFHVEGLTWKGELLFALPHKYGQPPFETMHSGGIFSTRTLERRARRRGRCGRSMRDVVRGLGMTSGPTHSEFIRAHADGKFYFLETAARVGGAYIAEVVEAASGLNPWIEWARMVAAEMRGETYALPHMRRGVCRAA